MTQLKIGFDAKRAVRNFTGLGNYSRLIVDALARRYPDNHYTLYAPDYKPNPRLDPILSLPNVELKLPRTTFAKALPSIWRVSSITDDIASDGIDIFHGLSNELPLNIAKSAIPSVVTIHDVIFRHFPQCYKPIDRKIYDYKFSKAARAATRVIAISRCTRDDIVNAYDIPAEKIDIVYQGCDPSFSRQVTDDEINSLRAKYALFGPFIVTIGTVETRKNQLLAVKALRGLPDDITLVIVGRPTPYADEIKRYIADNRLTRRVKWIEGAPFADLPVFYRASLFSTYTSRYEGFGLPVIESLSASTPVIIASGSCLEEAGGPDTPVVDPDDTDALIHQCRQLIDSPSLRASIAQAGREYVARFNQSTFTTEVMNVYQKAINQR